MTKRNSIEINHEDNRLSANEVKINKSLIQHYISSPLHPAKIYLPSTVIF